MTNFLTMGFKKLNASQVWALGIFSFTLAFGIALFFKSDHLPVAAIIWITLSIALFVGLAQTLEFFSSLKLAVVVILSLAVLLAYGTFYEADYGTAAAHKFVYQAWPISILLVLLITNLACAAIDRLPWTKTHTGFVITHGGIITLLVGSFITQQRGIDGSLPLQINETSTNFLTSDTDLHAWQNFDGRPFAVLFQKPIDFDLNPPEKKEYSFPLVDDDVLKVTKYIPSAMRQIQVTPSNLPEAKAAVKFSLSNPNVRVEEWLGVDGQIPSFYDLGPALVTFIYGDRPTPKESKNQILIFKKQNHLSLAIYSIRKAEPHIIDNLQIGKPVETGWMGLVFELKEYLPKSKAHIEYRQANKDETQTNAAIEISVGPNTRWLELGMPGEIKGRQSSYFISYTHRRFDLGFKMFLQKFKVGTYGGTNMPMSYESRVKVDDQFETNISMNEPLHFKDFTLYQASYETNDRGEPVTSIFSVNYDPGRNIKYLGSILICTGIAMMFWFKPKYTRKKKVS